MGFIALEGPLQANEDGLMALDNHISLRAKVAAHEECIMDLARHVENLTNKVVICNLRTLRAEERAKKSERLVKNLKEELGG